MAGSATITGRQNYVLGIGHPKTEAPTEGAPAVFSADGKSLVGVDGKSTSLRWPLTGTDSRDSFIPVEYSENQPTRFVATLSNPSGISYTNAPTAININFEKGTVLDLDQVVVYYNNSPIAFQFEPCVDYSDGLSYNFASWEDGSIRSGRIWVITSLSASEQKTFTVSVFSENQGQSFSQAVTYSVVSGTSEKMDTTGFTYQFESGQVWMLRRLFDKSQSSEDYFSGTNGVAAIHQIDGAVTNYSYTPAHVSLTSKGRIGASNFGYGVVYQDWETVFSWVNQPGLSTSCKYRVYADGSCDVLTYSVASNAISSSFKQLNTTVFFTKTGASTYEQSFPYGDTRALYSAKRTMVIPFGVQNSSEATPAGTYTAAVNLDSNGYPRFGWSGTTAVPAGAYWGSELRIVPGYALNDEPNIRLKSMNRLYSMASNESKSTILRKIKRIALGLVDDYCDWFPDNGHDTWLGCYALALLASGRTGHREAYDSFWTVNDVEKSVAGLTAWWNENFGFQYITRNANYARSAYLCGDVSLEDDIHMFAEFAASVTGEDGSVKLTGLYADNYNAEASAALMIASSLAIKEDTFKRDALNRILPRFADGVFSENWMAKEYSAAAISDVIANPATHYYYYQCYELRDAAHKIDFDVPIQSSSVVMYRMSNSVGQVNEKYASNAVNRRGALSTQIFSAGNVLLDESSSVSECKMALTALEYLCSYYVPSMMWVSPADGYTYDGGVNGQAMDLRVLSDFLLEI